MWTFTIGFTDYVDEKQIEMLTLAGNGGKSYINLDDDGQIKMQYMAKDEKQLLSMLKQEIVPQFKKVSENKVMIEAL